MCTQVAVPIALQQTTVLSPDMKKGDLILSALWVLVGLGGLLAALVLRLLS